MARISVPLTYGTESITIQVDEEFLAGPPITPRIPEGGRDPEEAIPSALANPMDRPRLSELARGKRVAVVVSDEFRFGLQEQIIDHLSMELSRSDPDSVTFICATGSHDPRIYASNIEKFVARHTSRHGLSVQFEAHDCDRDDLVDIGTTSRGVMVRLSRSLLSAEVRVFGHESKHHYMAGYSSIDKQILPGVSSRKTIEQNHKFSLSPDSGAGRSPWHPDPKRKKNPFSEDAKEARIMSEKVLLDPATRTLHEGKVQTFGLDMISSKDKIHHILAGDPNAICADMPGQADRFGLFTVHPARYVLISPGGPPACQALYGTQNCFDMALKGAVLPGGEVCVVAPCDGRPDLEDGVRGLAPDAKSKALFWDNLVRMRAWPMDQCLKYADEHFVLYLWKTIRVLRLFKEMQLRIGMKSTLAPELLAQGGFTSVADVQGWIDERAGRGDGKLWIIDKGNTVCVNAIS